MLVSSTHSPMVTRPSNEFKFLVSSWLQKKKKNKKLSNGLDLCGHYYIALQQRKPKCDMYTRSSSQVPNSVSRSLRQFRMKHVIRG